MYRRDFIAATAGAIASGTLASGVPVVETPLKKAQIEQYAISMESNPLVAIRAASAGVRS
jgi:hypothetical protein